MRVAIFGGTFNPVHWGHLLIAETAVSQFKLDRVLWVPAYHPPHKRQNLTSFEHRLAMVKLAIADNPKFLAVDGEAQRGGVSYAIDTLQHLQTLYPDALPSDGCWYWILGQDAFQTLPKWRGVEELAAACTWLIAPRTGAATHLASQPLALNYHFLEMPTIDLSSSLVRRYCQQGRSTRYLLPEAVRHYLQERQLL